MMAVATQGQLSGRERPQRVLIGAKKNHDTVGFPFGREPRYRIAPMQKSK
jgi:hypothetical protein